MPARNHCRQTRSTPRPTEAPVTLETVVSECEEPMRIWPHPICCTLPQPCPTERPDPCCGDLGQVLEALQCQNQLLLDILGSVNSLTAALLCRNDKM